MKQPKEESLAFGEIFEVNLALGIQKGSKQIGFWNYKKLRLPATHHRSSVSGDREMARVQWNMTDGNHGLGAILGFWVCVIMFALVVFGVIIFSCAEGAETRDKNDAGADTTAYGGCECVAGCGAACGG
ncbi:hypothetical protein L2E82_50350 [Cichorium intybus]|nr:hypothetical protein L2E82_50350 [Cichorium intybus]